MKTRGLTRGLELRGGAVCYDGLGSSGYRGTAHAQPLRGDTSNVHVLKELRDAKPKRKPRAKKKVAA